ncbi:MAG: hypothetical protein B6D62_01300 [Candidatus Cloacimonas sp. 4484_275]|nr:MAG: hypothetical protein B6D62_01300 [Candidatus Cloacimonas sp. 4484_275]
MENVKRIPVDTVYNLMLAVFSRLGVPKEDAKICADVLIASDLRGIESHGIGRLKMYYDRIKIGIQKPITKIDVIRDFAATAVWDGNHGMGHVIAFKAMKTAIEKAKKYRGKVEVLDRENKPTPEGCVIDDSGEYITDSKQILVDLVKNKASLVALGGRKEETGGHKGYGLAAIVEILSSAFQAGKFMHDLSGFDENGNRIPYHLGHFFMAINTDVFMGIDEFKKITGKIMTELQNSSKEPGKDKYLLKT